MRITYTEGVGIPIENLSDAEIANLLALLDAAIDKKLADPNAEHRKRVKARDDPRLYYTSYGIFHG